MPKIIVTADPMYRTEGPHTRVLREAGFEIVPPLARLPITDEQTIHAMGNVDAVLAGSEPYSERVFAALPGLRLVSRCGVGCDSVDLPAAERHGVVVTITPHGNYGAVAEHALALLLALTRSIVATDREVHRGVWQKTALVPVRGKTLGLVGIGRIGRAVAVRAAALGMHVMGADPVVSHDHARAHGIELTSLDELLARSDFISLHAPLTPETKGLINRAALAKMKPGAFLVNTARGGLVVEPDVVDALRSGRLAGAGLDVLVDEPPRSDNPLLALDNVVITPHLAASDVRAMEDMVVAAAQNIVDFFNGRLAPEVLVTRPRT
jgi:D-3-phosphoglycerate dehydrogenase